MRILVLAPQPPVTSRMPGSPRLFQFARHLAKQHELFLLHFPAASDASTPNAHEPLVGQTFREIVPLPPLPPARWRYRQLHRLARAPHFLTRFSHPGEHRRIRRLVAERAQRHAVDLVYLDDLSMLQYVPDAPALPLVVDVCDSVSLEHLQRARHARRLRDKLRWRLEARTAARHEALAGRRSQRLIAITEVDAAALRRVCPEYKVTVVPNGVDTEYFHPSDAALVPGRVVFTGVMGFGPNEDAVLYFCQEILPRVRSRCPDVQFWAVGSDAAPRLLELGKQPGVHVTGAVPDVRPYVWSAAAYVSPLRLGTGMKNKVLAALSMRRPVVATRASLHGLDVRHGEELLVADSPQDFADCLIRILEDRELARQLARRGHERVTERYSWQASAAQLAAVLEAAAR